MPHMWSSLWTCSFKLIALHFIQILLQHTFLSSRISINRHCATYFARLLTAAERPPAETINCITSGFISLTFPLQVFITYTVQSVVTDWLVRADQGLPLVYLQYRVQYFSPHIQTQSSRGASHVVKTTSDVQKTPPENNLNPEKCTYIETFEHVPATT